MDLRSVLVKHPDMLLKDALNMAFYEAVYPRVF
ncbi:hypothetical protein MAC3UK_0025 [Bdellovibrio phage MAC3UK]|nr:hypothetical protein MAC3UK_0025 [Bdellovibrio phage MAC3UK]